MRRLHADILLVALVVGALAVGLAGLPLAGGVGVVAAVLLRAAPAWESRPAEPERVRSWVVTAAIAVVAIAFVAIPMVAAASTR